MLNFNNPTERPQRLINKIKKTHPYISPTVNSVHALFFDHTNMAAFRFLDLYNILCLSDPTPKTKKATICVHVMENGAMMKTLLMTHACILVLFYVMTRLIATTFDIVMYFTSCTRTAMFRFTNIEVLSSKFLGLKYHFRYYISLILHNLVVNNSY